MSGCNGRAVSVHKTEAIVSDQHTKKALIPSVSAREQGRFVSVVVLRRRFSRQPASAARRHSGRNPCAGILLWVHVCGLRGQQEANAMEVGKSGREAID